MEDRHAISEPRPSLSKSGDDNNMPSWEVDILRDETVIVDTLVLNSEVLPPRTNKKGKVVWRLPDTAHKLVRLMLLLDLEHNNLPWITFFHWPNNVHDT